MKMNEKIFGEMVVRWWKMGDEWIFLMVKNDEMKNGYGGWDIDG
jgi:hypothetical protein